MTLSSFIVLLAKDKKWRLYDLFFPPSWNQWVECSEYLWIVFLCVQFYNYFFSSIKICVLKCVRRILNLHARTHNTLIPHLIDLLDSYMQIVLFPSQMSPLSYLPLPWSPPISLSKWRPIVLNNAPLIRNMLKEKYQLKYFNYSDLHFFVILFELNDQCVNWTPIFLLFFSCLIIQSSYILWMSMQLMNKLFSLLYLLLLS